MIDGNNSSYIEKVISNRRSINEPEKSISRSYHDLTPTESKSKKQSQSQNLENMEIRQDWVPNIRENLPQVDSDAISNSVSSKHEQDDCISV